MITMFPGGNCLWEATVCPSETTTCFADCGKTGQACDCDSPILTGGPVVVQEEIPPLTADAIRATAPRKFYSGKEKRSFPAATEAEAAAIVGKAGWNVTRLPDTFITRGNDRFDFALYKATNNSNTKTLHFGIRLENKSTTATKAKSVHPLKKTAGTLTNPAVVRELAIIAKPGPGNPTFHVHLGSENW